jgi:ferredoxin
MNGIYFSGTGNTRHCVALFASASGNGRAVSIENPEACTLLHDSAELVLGYPVYFSNIPSIVVHFLQENAESLKGKRVFIIATMGLFSGDGAGCGARLLRKYGASVTGGLHLVMPDCIGDVQLLKHSPAENKKTIERAEQKIRNAAVSIQNGTYPQEGLHFYNHAAGLFGQRLWYLAKAKALTKKLSIDSMACAGCGLCVNRCPMKAIIMKDHKAFFTGTCTLCYRCISSCPQKAITLIGKKVYEQCLFEKY